MTNDNLTFFCDNKRHLVCMPYSIENLHRMADILGIKRCWFHKNHYDIPKRRIDDMYLCCNIVRPRNIVEIIRGTFEWDDRVNDCFYAPPGGS